MFVGMAVYDVLFGDVHSLKQKRGLVRPLVAELQRHFGVAAAETGMQHLYRRTEIGVAVVGGEPGHCHAVLERVERWIAARHELDLLAATHRLRAIDDE
ncbi:MAG: DUF503 domain-containing protein [Actinomycetota bacterium]|nr:DUF503 domain-containing protein [Actinomycetota bacterium]